MLTGKEELPPANAKVSHNKYKECKRQCWVRWITKVSEEYVCSNISINGTSSNPKRKKSINIYLLGISLICLR